MTKAIVLDRSGARFRDYSLAAHDFAAPVAVELGAGEVQPKDRQTARGLLAGLVPETLVLGAQAVVRRIDDGSWHFCRASIGGAGQDGDGLYIEDRTVDASWLVPIPAGLDPVTAAAGTSVLTDARYALEDRAGLRSGEVVLVLGSSTGVGAAAIDIAIALGARVYAASRDPAAVPPRLGLTVFGYGELPDRVRAATNGHGADVVIDNVGGEFTPLGLRATARRARHVLLGYLAGFDLRLSIGEFLVGEAAVLGVNANSVPVRRQRELVALALEMLTTGKHIPTPITTAPLADGVELLTGAAPAGRTVLLGDAYPGATQTDH